MLSCGFMNFYRRKSPGKVKSKSTKQNCAADRFLNVFSLTEKKVELFSSQTQFDTKGASWMMMMKKNSAEDKGKRERTRDWKERKISKEEKSPFAWKFNNMCIGKQAACDCHLMPMSSESQKQKSSSGNFQKTYTQQLTQFQIFLLQSAGCGGFLVLQWEYYARKSIHKNESRKMFSFWFIWCELLHAEEISSRQTEKSNDILNRKIIAVQIRIVSSLCSLKSEKVARKLF